MKKSRVILLVAALVALGIAAGVFDYPRYANQGIGWFNGTKEEVPLLRTLPAVPAIPEVPFLLGLDLQGGLHLVYEADLSEIRGPEREEAMKGLRDVIERRVNLFGVQEPVVQTQGEGVKQRLIVELAGIESPARAAEIIGQTPYLEFRELKENAEEIEERNQQILQGEEEGELEDPFQATALTGRFLENAALGFGQVANEPVIQLQFDEEGAELFEDITARNVGRPLAIYLDNQPLQAPVVQEAIAGGQAQITGSFSREEAREVVRNLNAGALPVPISLLAQEQVGSALGERSLQESVRAGAWGLAFILLFMVLFYRMPGILAAVALLFYGAIVLALFKLIPVTLTLAGMAGLILSIGMAVDANILVFSRIREELRGGRSFPGAVEEGFRRAWPSIRDGNITTLLVAVILFWVGSSFVRGFAFTLSLGIIVSMFSAMVMTKSLLRLFEGTRIAGFLKLWI